MGTFGGAKKVHPFFRCGILAKNIHSQKLWTCKKKNLIPQIFHQKKFQKVLMKIEDMADVFLNSSIFANHIFLTLAPHSRYAWNVKALITLSNGSWISQFSYQILRSSFERKFDKTNFISPKSPHYLGIRLLVYLKKKSNIFTRSQLELSQTYRISSYSFRGNYSFLNLEIQRSQYMRPKVTVHKCAETIQGRKLHEQIR